MVSPVSEGSKSGDGMDSRRLQAFFKTHRRQDRRDAFGEHRLAGAGRPDHEHVVTAGHRDFNRAFGMVLSAHIAEVFETCDAIACGESLAFDAQRLDVPRSIDEIDDFGKRSHGINRNAVDDGGFSRIAGGNEQMRNLQIPRQHRDREDSLDRPEFSVQRQFSDHQIVGEILTCKQSVAAKNADGQRQIEGRTFLFHVGRREIDGDALIRGTESVVANRRDDAAARFTNGSIRQSDDIRTRPFPPVEMLTSTSTRYASMP